MANKLAVCDPGAFEPFRRLVEGPVTHKNDLEASERFIRTVVLHDELTMGIEPFSYRAEDYEEQRKAIVKKAASRADSYAPGDVAGIVIMFTETSLPADKLGYGLFGGNLTGRSVATVELSSSMLDVVSRYSNAERGNPFYVSHLLYLQKLFGVVSEGGSILCEHPFPRAAIERATQFPVELFQYLDEDWKKYARKIHSGRLDLVIPPLLAIVLNNCARRDAIPAVLIDLRRDWAGARRKIWKLVEDQKNARTLKEMYEIDQEFAEASKSFSPASQGKNYSSPRRMLWDIFAAASSNAVTATLSGGNPKIGALVGGLTGALTKAVPQITSGADARKLFRLGAFDLASRVRDTAESVEPMPDILSRFLSDTEKQSLGYNWRR
jgi:hypothetical protein